MLGVVLLHEFVEIQGGSVKYLVTFFWFIIALIFLAFTILNSNHLIINFYVGTVSIYLPLVLLFFLVVGSLLGLFALLATLMQSKQKNTKSTSNTIQREIIYGHLTSDQNINISKKKRIKQDILNSPIFTIDFTECGLYMPFCRP